MEPNYKILLKACRKTLGDQAKTITELLPQVARLKATNAELLEALKAYMHFTKWVPYEILREAKQAIRHTEEQTK